MQLCIINYVRENLQLDCKSRVCFLVITNRKAPNAKSEEIREEIARASYACKKRERLSLVLLFV